MRRRSISIRRARTGAVLLIVLSGALSACAASTSADVRADRSPTTSPAAPTVPPTAPPTTPPLGVPVDAPDRLELVFNEDFDDDTLAEAWSTCYWWQVDGGCTISSNDEQQWYRPEAVSIADGALRLTLSDDPQTTTDGERVPFRSGMVTTGHVDNDATDAGFEFTFGVVEARIRLPRGDGLWPAVWLLSADRTSLPEIDVIEWYATHPREVTSHVHQRIDGERASRRIDVTSAASLADRWVDVAVEWMPDRVVFYLDGVETGRVTDTDLIPDTPMYVIINLAAGGPAGDVDASVLPQALLVDHVRVWQEVDR